MSDLRPAQDVAADLIGPCEKVYPKWCKPHNAPMGDRTTCLTHVRVTALIEAYRREAMRLAWDAGYTTGFYAAQPLPSSADASEGSGINPYGSEDQ